MDLKNATAVCLIALVSATLVLLIARALDLQAAKRLEPRLAEIAQQLEAIRRQVGGSPSVEPAGGPVAPADPAGLDEGLLVYYFHGNTRCPTCRSIESQARAAVDEHFAEELQRGDLAWKMLNYEGPDGEQLATEFDVLNAVVVLARKQDGRIVTWRRLDEVWGVVDDPPAFAELMQEEIRRMLAWEPEGSTEAAN